ncbi:MAG: ATP-binding cassette domain-containing protein, partial [Hominilimicola sp.]
YTSSLFTFLNAMGAGSILIFGVWKILSGSMTTGILIAAQSLAAAMLSPVGAMVNTGIEMQNLNGEKMRTNDVMNYGEDKKFLGEEITQEKDIVGDIELKNVSFGYNPVDEPFIQDFNLTLKKGKTVAITGESGSGKSTIAKIIAGIYCETGGSVTFNGALRNEINQNYFYSKMAMVSQDIRLFEGTVLDNITMWDDSISYENVVAAAKAACIHDDIISRSDGYRENVTENGKNFSSGQKQRIEIARALVKNPSLIIFDEATSALDTDTEARVMDNIKSLGITKIIVSHRLSAIMDSDEIIVMDGGKVAERGTHDELMKRQGKYYSLIRSAD